MDFFEDRPCVTQRWTIRLLGRLQTSSEDQVHDRFRTQKAAALLAHLALNLGTPVPRDQLVEQLWPGADPGRGRQSLSTELSALRRQLETRGRTPGSVLLATRAALKLRREAVVTDVETFEEALDRAAASEGGDPDAPRAHLEAAVAAYGGELGPGLYDERILRERERLTGRFIAAVDALSGLARQRGEAAQAVEYAQRAVAADPLHEASWRTLLTAYAHQGAPHKALEQYRALERLFAEELDAPPSEETRALAEQIARSSGADLDRIRTPPAPEPAGKASPTPPLRPEDPATTASPLLPTLFGREQELADLAAQLREPGLRLLTITGPGGVGKTRLAQELLRRHAEAPFTSGARFCSLAEVDDAELVPHTLLAGIGPPGVGAAGATVLDSAIGALGRLGCELLILDNLEQLVPEVLPTLRSLLERIPSLRCVVTSRRRLGISGERALALRPLPVPPETADSEELLTFASVRLFCDRARSVSPDFTLTETNAPHLAQLCARLDGLPLALDLAAGWTHVLSPEQMVGESLRRLSELTSRARDVPERHRSLSAAMATSHELLREDLQQLFRRLGVFRGSFTLEAAEAVCEDPLALDGLAELIDASLLEPPSQEGGEPRFRTLETVRSFAVAQLEPHEREAARKRLLGYLQRRVAAGQRLAAGPERAAWVDSLASELPNLRQVLAWLIGTRPEEALSLCRNLFPLWRLRALPEGRRWLSRSLAGAQAPSAMRASALLQAGTLATHAGDLQEATAVLEEAADLARASGNLRALANAECAIGLAAEYAGNLEEARVRSERSLALHRESAGVAAVSAAQSNLSRVLMMQDRLDEAYAHADECHRLCHEQGLWRGEVAAQAGLGRVLQRRGQYESARAHYQAGLERSREVADDVFATEALLNLTSLLSDTGQLDAARDHLARARALSEEIGFHAAEAAALVLTSEIARREGDFEQALDRARHGLALSAQGRARTHPDRLMLVIASSLRALGRDGEARAQLRDLLTLVSQRAGGRATSLTAAGLQCAASLLADKRPTEAAAYLGAAAAIRTRLGTPVPPADRPHLDAQTEKLRAQLGDADFRAAMARGGLDADAIRDRFIAESS